MRFAPFHDASHDIVLGVSRSGKTHLVRELVARVRRCWFFDPTRHDYSDEGERMTLAELCEPERHRGVFSRVVYSPGEQLPVHHYAREFLRAARTVGRTHPLLVVMDELGDYSRFIADELARLHRNGHHEGVTSLLVAQSAVDVPKPCRRNATRVVSLLQVNADDLAALAKEYDPTSPGFSDRVRNWRPGAAPVVWTLPTLHHS